MCVLTSDHNLGRATVSGLEVGGGGNEGSRPELPVGLRHAGDGGPRGRALPAGRRLFHSAAASGRNLLVIPPHVKKKKSLHHTSIFLLSNALFVAGLLLPSVGMPLKLNPGISVRPLCSCS